jgi:hypothetical protein
MKTFTIIYWYVDDFDADYDRMEEVDIRADDQETALRIFKKSDLYDRQHYIQCVIEKRVT